MTVSKTKSARPVVLILAGGKGERFWPRSRERTPKQLQKVYSSKTLLEETLIRAKKVTSISRIYIGCNEGLKKSILATHKGLSDKNFIIEPEGKNTAPIIALASLQLEKMHPGAVHIILSADHYISPLSEFKKTIDRAVKAAEEGFLVTIGIRPTRPEMGYGYIESSGSKDGLYSNISSFREKPGLSVAVEYLESGRHYWNAGIFIWSGKTILQEFENHAKHIIEPVRNALQKKGKNAIAAVFRGLKSEPVDIAIMEKSRKIVMVPASFTWDDVGSWLSLERICSHDDHDNVFIAGTAKSSLFTRNSTGNIVSSSTGLVALLGVNDLVIVEDGDVIMISTKEKFSEIKELIAEVRKNPSLQKYLV
ncbi:MAG: sugar phosphate nucleotidyltransferase [Spirochaetia bacterium]|nr:sugar phosphate nucleotidyltransferase [Spirochaetia bacterium]